MGEMFLRRKCWKAEETGQEEKNLGAWKLTRIGIVDASGASWDLGDWGILGSLRVWKFLRVYRFVKWELNPPGALYRRRN